MMHRHAAIVGEFEQKFLRDTEWPRQILLMLEFPARALAENFELPQSKKPIIRWGLYLPNPIGDSLVYTGSYNLPVSAWLIGTTFVAYLKWVDSKLANFSVRVESTLEREEWLNDSFM